MRYQAIPHLSRQQVTEMLSGDSIQDTQIALLSSALHDPDLQWVEAQCIEFACHRNKDVQSTAVQCFGHLARTHNKLHTTVIIPLLHNLRKDPFLAGVVSDALDDIAQFIG